MFPLVIVAVMIAIGAISLYFFYFFSKTVRMIASTTGQVISAEEHVRRNEHRRWEETVILCRFEAQGEVHEVDLTVPGRQADRFPPGRVIPVRYNPESPDKARVAL